MERRHRLCVAQALNFVAMMSIAAFAAMAGGAMPAAAAEDTQLVLVAGARSTIAPMSAAQVRRLYLGIPTVQSRREITPLGNMANAGTNEMFLQHVLFMSALAYERQMTTRVYRTGGSRIRTMDDPRALVDALTADLWAVSYMTADAAAREPGLRVVNTL